MAMPYKSQMNQYKRMKIETASPEMLILMLYDGAIKNIRIAHQGMDNPSEIETCSNSLIKAQNIITELMVSLNFEIGGDIARNLFNIYEFVNYTLAQCNVNKNTDNLDTVITMLTDLRETWKEVIKINKEKYPNGIPRPEGIDESNPQNPMAGTTRPSEQMTQQNVNQQEPAPQNPEQSTPPPAQPAAPTPPQNNKVTRQANRFKQVYGKNLPRKI